MRKCERCGSELGAGGGCPACRSRELTRELSEVRRRLTEIEDELAAIREEASAWRERRPVRDES